MEIIRARDLAYKNLTESFDHVFVKITKHVINYKLPSGKIVHIETI